MVSPSPQVTIIVPVFNVADYLPETLESIAAQTVFDRCHVILVDDGSTDGSDTIAKQFAAEHPNVTALQQENAGPGAARNRALDMAETPYVSFVDSDDILPPRAVELLLKAIVQHQASIAVGDMDTFPKPTAFLWKKPFGKGDRLLQSVVDAPDLIFDAGPCHKLYDLAQLRQHGLRFQEGVHFEDAFLALPMLLRAERIALVDEVVYQYRKRDAGTSIMDNLFTREQNFWDHLLLCDTIAALRPELDVFRREVLDRWLVRSYQGFAMRAHTLFEDADLWKIFETCSRIYQDVDPSFIARWTLDTRHRVPYLAFKSYDFELFARPWERLRTVVACGGELHLDYPVTPALLPLTQVTSVGARVEQVRLSGSGDTLRVSGHMVINGLPMRAPISISLGLRVRGSSLTVPVTVQRRIDMKASDEDREWCGFSAEIPVSQLRNGQHSLRLVFDTETGQASRQCLITAAYLRDATMKRSGDVRILPTHSGRESAELLVRRQGGVAGRRRWHRMLVRKDLRHVASRAPFWKWRLLRLLTEPIMRRRNVWLIGERTDTAQDNSSHLFRYLRKVERRRNVYYLLTKDSPDRERLRGLGNVVTYDSFRHRFLMLHATKLINSYDIDSYMLPSRWERSRFLKHLNWRIGPARVFLDHGVIEKDVSAGVHRGRASFDLFVTSADREAEYVSNDLDYGDMVANTCLPRFDALVPDRGGRRILFMPTWRTYLVAPSYNPKARPRIAFDGSAYQTFVSELFGSERLRESLRRYGYKLELLPHYEMRKVLAGFVPEDDCFAMADQTKRTVQDALRQCDLFITDYSSTAVDVAYLGTPLIYAQFDSEEFWKIGGYRKGYFEHREDGFGPVCETADETVDAIIRYLENGCVREEEYSRRAAEFFAFQDRNNCQRVAAAIAALPGPQR
ncbi:CDP-glycerol glycerophosphotransferase family protein [Micromonospora olivasterospora]|uniref:CDP-glycerol glycerophosphotransferase (TagB/SpsB family) n=1 Tax=Micromonospora olivasterospora TaxID=1880 RepID=A0A562IEG7_MICOL|nr:CDP-glycerol glycerophosphotransferase family protein [Micromonospora olivasterospora]TWH69103.1 CDP-glycerol glycerophosphotransferase (TagB/SpsB family) [Micromonospora olivasterospora]